MRRTPLLAGTIAALALSALPATAQTPFTPVLVDTPTYLVCEGATKVANANAQAGGARATTWDATPPTGSVQGGAGCGNVDTFLGGANPGNPVYDFPLAGTHTGNLDSMTVELHSISTLGRAVGQADLAIELSIDGKVRATALPVVAPFTTSSTGASQSVTFTLTGIGLLSEAENRTHTIEMTVKSRFADRSLVNGWVWDTVEVPSGIRFNPATPAATTVNL